jgi:antitoxin (DNA-binding transcriptional repressor) of toxin-antitoxin stability system
MTHIELQKAQEQFLELIELAASGEEVIISKGEKPFVKLVSASRLPIKRQFGSAKGLIIIADDFDDPLEDFQEYR